MRILSEGARAQDLIINVSKRGKIFDILIRHYRVEKGKRA